MSLPTGFGKLIINGLLVFDRLRGYTRPMLMGLVRFCPSLVCDK